MFAAVAKTIKILSECNAGTCAVPNLKRQWLHSLATSSFHCGGQNGTNLGQFAANTEDGFLAVPGSKNVIGFNRFRTYGKVDIFIAKAQFNLSESTLRQLYLGNWCLESTIAHEALHPVLYMMSPLGERPQRAVQPSWLEDNDDTHRPGTLESILNPGDWNLIERYIETAVSDCKVCR